MQLISTHHVEAAFVLVVIASVIAAVFDVRTRRIPNALAIALFAAGLAVNAAAGLAFAGIDVAVTAAVLVLGTVAFTLRLIGGGDIKLLAAACGALGFPACAVLLAFTFICGGVIALGVSFARGNVRSTISNVKGLAMPMFAGVRPTPLKGGTSMPYALAICAGALLTFVTNGTLPHLRF